MVEFYCALLGAVVGGLFALLAAWYTNRLFRSEQTEREASELDALVSTLYCELETLFDRYMETMGKHIDTLKENEPLLMLYPVYGNFFSVYDANASNLGKIKNLNIQKQVVRTYTFAKGLVDMYRFNNELIQKLEQYYLMANLSKDEQHTQAFHAQQQMLNTYSTNIKSMHCNTLAELTKLRELVTNNLATH